MHREVGLRAEGRAERRRARHLRADDQRAHLVEADAAVRLRHVDAEQTEVAAALDERARQRPVLLFEAIEHRQDLAVDELLRRLPDQPVLVGQTLGREDRRRRRRLEQPFAAAQDPDGFGSS